MQKGYGQSMSFLAYFLTMFSSPKRKSDLLTVKQFCRTGMGLYKAIVRALCALVCLKAPGVPPAGAEGPCRLRFWSEPPSPEPSLPATASPKRAILEENTQVSRSSPTKAGRGGCRAQSQPQPPPPLRVMLSSVFPPSLRGSRDPRGEGEVTTRGTGSAPLARQGGQLAAAGTPPLSPKKKIKTGHTDSGEGREPSFVLGRGRSS